MTGVSARDASSTYYKAKGNKKVPPPLVLGVYITGD